MSFAPENQTLAKPESLFRVPVGLASPLWGLFAGAAMSGAAWWWMTRWMRPQNLEALFAAAGEAETVAVPEMAALAAPALAAVEAVEPVVEAIAADIAEPPIEAAAKTALEAAAEAMADVTPQPAPEPVVEALAEAPLPVEAAMEAVVAEPAVYAQAVADVAAPSPVAPKPKKKAAVTTID